MLVYMLNVACLHRIRQGNVVKHTCLVHLRVQETAFMGLCLCVRASMSLRQREKKKVD